MQRERVLTENTTYTADNPQSNTKSRHRSSMDVNRYKTQTMKQIFIKGTLEQMQLGWLKLETIHTKCMSNGICMRGTFQFQTLKTEDVNIH